jgi:hypothetical protein
MPALPGTAMPSATSDIPERLGVKFHFFWSGQTEWARVLVSSPLSPVRSRIPKNAGSLKPTRILANAATDYELLTTD